MHGFTMPTGADLDRKIGELSAELKERTSGLLGTAIVQQASKGAVSDAGLAALAQQNVLPVFLDGVDRIAELAAIFCRDHDLAVDEAASLINKHLSRTVHLILAQLTKRFDRGRSSIRDELTYIPRANAAALLKPRMERKIQSVISDLHIGYVGTRNVGMVNVREISLKVLRAVHDASTSNAFDPVDIDDIAELLRLSKIQTNNALTYLTRLGLIDIPFIGMRLVEITHKGIEEIVAANAHPDQPTPTMHIAVDTMINSNIQLGTDRSRMVNQVAVSNKQELSEAIDELPRLVDTYLRGDSSFASAREALDSLKSEAAKSTPNVPAVRMGFRWLRTVFDGAVQRLAVDQAKGALEAGYARAHDLWTAVEGAIAGGS